MGLTSHQGLGGRFWLLIAATFLGFLGFGTVLPGLAPHVRHDLGGSDRTVGFAIGTFSAVALASRLFAGRLADRRGRKIAFLTGLGSCTLAGVAYLLPLGLTGIFTGRMFQGFGEACLYTGAAAWTVEVAGLHRSARALGFLSSGIWGGISAGPMIGHWLGTFERAAAFQVFAALTAFALLTRIPEHFKPDHHSAKQPWLRRSLLAPGIAIGFVNVHYPVIAGFLILHLADKGNSGPAAFSAYAGCVLLSRFLLGGLPDRVDPRITFFGGLAGMAVGLSILAVGPAPPIAIGGAALLGLGFSFPWSSVAGRVMRGARDSERGSSVSVLSAFYDLFVGISSFSAGLVANRFGYPAAFMMAVAALAAAAVAGTFVFSAAASEEAELEDRTVASR